MGAPWTAYPDRTYTEQLNSLQMGFCNGRLVGIGMEYRSWNGTVSPPYRLQVGSLPAGSSTMQIAAGDSIDQVTVYKLLDDTIVGVLVWTASNSGHLFGTVSTWPRGNYGAQVGGEIVGFLGTIEGGTWIRSLGVVRRVESGETFSVGSSCAGNAWLEYTSPTGIPPAVRNDPTLATGTLVTHGGSQPAVFMLLGTTLTSIGSCTLIDPTTAIGASVPQPQGLAITWPHELSLVGSVIYAQSLEPATNGPLLGVLEASDVLGMRIGLGL